MFAVLHLPHYSLQAVLRHEPEMWLRAVAVVDSSMTVPRVMDLTMTARDAGVVEGATAPQALARCRDIQIRQRSTSREAEMTEAVLQCVYGFSPNLESTAPGLVTMDLRGLAELGIPRHGSPAELVKHLESGTPARAALRNWVQRLNRGLENLGIKVRIGIGPSPNIAQHASRWVFSDGDPVILKAAIPLIEGNHDAFLVLDSAGFLSRLPVAALSPSSEVAGILRGWGIETVGQFTALGQAELADRLGLETLGLFAAASVDGIRPLRIVQPAQRFHEKHEFETGIEVLEPLLFLLRRFIDSLAQRLEAFGLAAGTLRLKFRLESGQELDRELRVPQPTRRPDVLFRMLHTHLESLRASSPVKAVALQVEPVRPEQKQFSLFEAALRDPHQFQETLARLAAIVGPDRVGSPRRIDTHQPDAFVMTPPEFDQPAETVRQGVPELQRTIPLRKFRPSLKAEVECAHVGELSALALGHRPLTLRCAIANGKTTVQVGPARSSGQWWDEKQWHREEWDVRTRDGSVLRLVRSGEQWQVEGMLD